MKDFLHSAKQRLKGCFVGVRIRELFKDDRFNNLLRGDARQTYCLQTFSGLLGQKTTCITCIHTCITTCTTLQCLLITAEHSTVEDMLMQYQKPGCHTCMSLKIYFLHSHRDFFPHNCGK